MDIIALGTIDIILPPLNQLSLLGQINICNILELPVVNPMSCKINCASSCSRKDIHLNQLVPPLTFNIPVHGNCFFSTLSYIITGSTSFSYKMRKIITDNIMGKLNQICLKFIQNKFPPTYRNTREYISKSKMHMDKIWGGDIELFSMALLINTDIWVNTTEMKNKWIVYSGKGASSGQIMNCPPANDAGSCYIKHTVDPYEPILDLHHITSDNLSN